MCDSQTRNFKLIILFISIINSYMNIIVDIFYNCMRFYERHGGPHWASVQLELHPKLLQAFFLTVTDFFFNGTSPDSHGTNST
jgi:hypothetical protein